MQKPYKYDPDKITYFGITETRGKHVPFGIRAEDRARHMYTIGKTGMGKSTLMENMAIQDIQNGEGICFIDPHGGSAEKLLDYIPEDRMEDVIYFAPFDIDHPVAFNIMEDVGYDKRFLVVAGLMSSFYRIWQDAWSSRMEYILQNTLFALLEYPDTTLMDVNRMLINKAFRDRVVENIKDPTVKKYWAEEFAGYSDQYAKDATPAIQNKIGQFTSNPLVRNIIGQPKSSFDIREVMDSRKILIVNLSKGRMGEQNADLLGSLLVTKIYLAAMSRAEETPETLKKLPPFYLYVDEFQSVVNDSFANILSEARKYKLALTIGHQYIEQIEENIRNAVFGNVGTTVTYRVGPLDADMLERMFQPTFMAEDLVNLSKYQMYLTLMIDGAGSEPFSATGIPPVPEPEISFRKQILDISHAKYAKPRAEIEEMIQNKSAEDKNFEREASQKAQKAFEERGGGKKPYTPNKNAGGNTFNKKPNQKFDNSKPRFEKKTDFKRKDDFKKKDFPQKDSRPPRQQMNKQKTDEQKARNELQSILSGVKKDVQKEQKQPQKQKFQKNNTPKPVQPASVSKPPLVKNESTNGPLKKQEQPKPKPEGKTRETHHNKQQNQSSKIQTNNQDNFKRDKQQHTQTKVVSEQQKEVPKEVLDKLLG